MKNVKDSEKQEGSIKRKKRRHKKKQDASTTKVYFSEPEDLPCYANLRLPRSFRVDIGLWEALKPELKRRYGSICRGIEVFGAAVLHNDAEKVYLCNTVNPLTINQTVVREMRPRRKLVVDEVADEVLEKPVSGSPEKCAVCDRPSYAKCINKDDSVVWLCRKHFREQKRSFKGWLSVKDFRERSV